MKSMHESVLAATLLLSLQTARAGEETQPPVTELPKLIVTDEHDIDAEQQRLTETLGRVPGGTNLIDLDARKGSQSTVAKVLDFEPGIIVQEFFGGNDQPRLNIRGSGIQDNPVSRGMQLLQDGLALNQPDGSFIIGLLDPEQAQYVSVYRGANAVRYGGTTLGGAIDFSLRNALNTPSSVSVEAGSWGMRKGALSAGVQTDRWDAFVRTSYQQSDGWRTHSDARRGNLTLNLGFRGGAWENRTYLHVTDNRFEIPFLLTKARALSDPRSVIGDYADPDRTSLEDFLNVRTRRPMRQTRQQRLANKTAWYGDVASQSVGFYVEQIDDDFKSPAWQANTDVKNYGLDYAFEYTWRGGGEWQTHVETFLSANTGEMPREYFLVHPRDGGLVRSFGDLDLDAGNVVAGAQAVQNLGSQWQAVAALQYARNTRDIADRRAPGLLDSRFDYSSLNPKAGIIFNANERARYYANVSRSSEAPTFWQLVDLGPGSVPASPASLYLMTKPLQIQTANTFEIGTQQRSARLGWEATYFYSVVNDELIAEVRDFAIDGTTVNYDHDTIHRGVELGVNARTPAGLFGTKDYLTFRGVYNWSHFTFHGGRYDGKRIAGVPVHLIAADIGYQLSDAFSIGINARWQPEDTPIDHYNGGLEQDAYLLLGANLTYQPSPRWKWFVDLHNLTNQTYQTAYVVRGLSAEQANSGLSAPSFVPGPEFHLSAGVTHQW